MNGSQWFIPNQLMSSLTLHSLDNVLATRLRRYAAKHKRSLNQSAKELLASALGIGHPTQKVKNDHCAEFEALSGVWTRKNVRDFEKATAAFSEIEESLWK